MKQEMEQEIEEFAQSIYQNSNSPKRNMEEARFLARAIIEQLYLG